MSAKKKTTILAICAAVAIVAIAVIALWPNLAPIGSPSRKTITLEAVFGDGSEMNYVIATGERYLGPALRAEGLIGGDESAYGYFVTSVAGVEADAGNEEWWSLSKDGKFAEKGVDETVIHDGDVFRFTLTVGYEQSAA